MRMSPPRIASNFLILTLLTVITAVGCSRPPWPSETTDARRVIDRLQARQDSVHSGTYRVRWRARGTDPHGEFLLDIAYKSPGLYRVSANGPLGVLAFTAVVRGEEFWFIDHPNNQLTIDSLANLGDYELPLADFFTGLWRDLFSGGWGGGEGVRRLLPANKRGWYEGTDGTERVAVRWDEKHARPLALEIRKPGPEKETKAEIEFHSAGDAFPFWELDRIQLEGFPGGGSHTWTLLRQTYNIDIPDRLFDPLEAPEIEGR